MTARTCQLCGKPLSRLRVGGDGDFCSREHRNQHRLRCGMDRLEEANKVTSLMRRRENPRHISAARLMCNSALDRRGFFEAKHPSARTDIASFSRTPPAPASPRVASANRYVAPRAARLTATESSRRADPSRIRINGRGTVPLVPPRRQKLRRYRFPRRPSSPCTVIRRRQPPRRAISGCCARAEVRVHSRRRHGVRCARSPPRADAGEPGSSAKGCICRRGRQGAEGLDRHRIPRSRNELARSLHTAAAVLRAGVAANPPPHFARVPRYLCRLPEPGGRNLEVAYLPARGCQRNVTRRGSYSREPSRRATGGPSNGSDPRTSHHGHRLEAVRAPFQGHGGAAAFRRICPAQRRSSFYSGSHSDDDERHTPGRLHGLRPAGTGGLPEGHLRRHGGRGNCRLAGHAAPVAPRLR